MGSHAGTAAYKTVFATVTKSSTTRVGGKAYSVPSRLADGVWKCACERCRWNSAWPGNWSGNASASRAGRAALGGGLPACDWLVAAQAGGARERRIGQQLKPNGAVLVVLGIVIGVGGL